MNNRIKFGSHVKLSVCLMALLVASESLVAKKGAPPLVNESAGSERVNTTLQPKKNAGKIFKKMISALEDEKHLSHDVVKSALSTSEGFKDCTQHLSLGNISKLAKIDPEYNTFAVTSLLGSSDKKRVQHAGSMASEIFNDAGATQHHESVKRALLAYFQTADKRVLPLERVQTFMGKGELLDFWGSLYLFKSKDDKKRAAAEEKLLGALKNPNHPHHEFTKTQLQAHFQDADKRIVPLETMEKIFKEMPDLTLHGSLYLFKSDDAKKHAVGFENLKEILSDPQHPSHHEAHNILNSNEKLQESVKKLSKKQQDALLSLLNSNNNVLPAEATQMPQVNFEGILTRFVVNQEQSASVVSSLNSLSAEQQDEPSQNLVSENQINQSLSRAPFGTLHNASNVSPTVISFSSEAPQQSNVSFNPNGYATEAFDTLNQRPPVPTLRTTKKEVAVAPNEMDFTDILNKLVVNQEQKASVASGLKRLSAERQNALFQHLESNNPQNGYALSEGFESFRNTQSSLTQEEKTLLEALAFTLNPQF